MKIKNDESLNKELAEKVQYLRGLIVEEANKEDKSSLFTYVASNDSPSYIITNKENEKSCKIPLYAYSNVVKALYDLTEGNKTYLEDYKEEDYSNDNFAFIKDTELILNKLNNKVTKVPLFAYKDIKKALFELF